MALPAHVVHTAAGLPVDESTRPELIEFGAKLLRAENVRQDTRGAVSKRDGFAALALPRTDATSPTAGYKVFADRSSIVRITDTLQAESFSYKAQTWTSLGRVPEATARIIDLPSMGITTHMEDVDATNGYVAVAWGSVSTAGSMSAYLAIVDQATGAIVRPPELVGTAVDFVPPLLAVQGNYFVMARYNSTGTKIQAWYLDTTSAATITTGWVAFAASLCTDCEAGGALALHALPHASTPRIALLYINNSGGANQLTLKTFNVGGVVQTQAIPTDSVTPDAFAIGGISTDTLWLTWNEATSIYAQGVSPFTISSTLATRAVLFVMAAGCGYLGIAGSTTAGKARVWSTDTSLVPPTSTMRGITTTAGAAAADGLDTLVPWVQMARKPFFYAGRYYGAFYNTNASLVNDQSNFFVCDWTEISPILRPIANPAPGLATTGLSGLGKFVAGSSSSVFLVGFNVKRSAIADGSALLELDFANSKRWQVAAHGNSTFLAAAVPSCFDGARVAEVGFLYRPSKPTTATSATGITAATGWRYIAVYEETDSDGNWHVSGLSDPSASTGAVANKTVTISTAPLCITSRQTITGASARAVRVAIYRTADGGLAPYYRVGTSLSTGYTSVSYADTTTDAVLITASKLYAQPGVLGTAQDRRPPPSFSSVTSYNGMLVGAAGSDLWYSGQDVAGEGAWFSPIFQIPIPGEGDITALAVMDGALFAFKRREVYAIAGEPPSDNGASGGLGAPRRLSCDVGCIDSRSTCTTALAIFFQSERGIEVLTRAQTVEWIGEPFATTLAAFPICTSITVEPVSNTVLVELAATESAGLVTGSGCTLVYDLGLRCWVSKDIRTAQEVLGRPSQSACMLYTGTAWRYAWLSTDARVFCETPGTSLDAGVSWITALYETAHAKHGLQQEQRIWNGVILFEQSSAAGLKIEVGYDYAAYSSANDKVWTETEALSQRQLPWRPKPRGQAMRFRVSDSAPAVYGTGKGFIFVGMSLDTAAKQGPTTGTPRLAPTLRK